MKLTHNFRTTVLTLALAAAAAFALLLPAFFAVQTPAGAALSISLTDRTARAQTLITQAGAGAKLKVYNGTRPAGTGAITGGNTLCATGTFGSTIGTATSGTIDFDEAGFTQNNSTFVNCTPTFVDVTTSGDRVVMRIDIGVGAGNWQFSGTVVNGQNISLTTLVITEGNAS
jgi:hypothetical protein